MINFNGLQRRLDEIARLNDLASLEFDACVQAIADTHRVYIATTGHMSGNFSVARVEGKWFDEYSGKFSKVFAELNRLETIAIDFGIGQGNLQRWTPAKK